MRIMFMGSPAFAVPSLEALKASPHEVIAVITQPDRPSGRKLPLHSPAVKVAAQKLGIRVLQPATTRTPEFVAEMAALKPEVLVVVAYGEILRANLLELPPRGAVNLHASLLPKYRGSTPVARAILRGETETGATTMLVNAAMDAGPILLQTHCAIDPEDNTETLTEKIALLGAPLLTQTIDLWEKGEITPRSQDETQVTFAPKLKKEDGLVDWNRPADLIVRQIRAFHPWPGSFTYLEGTLIKLRRGRCSVKRTQADPGVIVEVTRETILVACGESTVLELAELQPQDRSVLTAADFIHGYRIRSAARFTGTQRM